MDSLENKVVIVTGATSGIGAATAIEFAKEGATVVVVGRNADRGNAKVAEIAALGGNACFIACDVMKDGDIQKLTEAVIDRYGKIDVVVNNAGIFHHVPLEQHTEAMWDNSYDSNVTSVFRMFQYTLPHVIASKGNYINISSAAGLSLGKSAYAYSASKAALIHFSKQMAKNYSAQGIRINVICPGVIQTPIFGGADVSGLGPTIPMQRVGIPEEVAKPIVFLASDAASYITGAVLAVDGGMVL